jgi:hypothetical protein
MPQVDSNDEARKPIGHAWLRQNFQLAVPQPAVESYIVAGARRTEIHGSRVVELYPRQYSTDESPVSHLRFALRHEPTDLGILVATLKAIDPKDLQRWIAAEPTGAFSRRAWFFYETFTGNRLDIPNARSGNYVSALDEKRHIVAAGKKSQRHRVIDNLLGGPGLCTTVRRTPRLQQQMGLHIDEEARALIESYDPLILSRAVNYLYKKETRSSFAIEGEKPSSNRVDRFVDALKATSSFDPSDKQALIALQGSIVDPRYRASDWRDFQIYVGETVAGYREEVHFIAPRPEDVSSLMEAWMLLTGRVVSSGADPVVAAALSAFAFVFIHPFVDGNGRIHRFMIHHILAKRNFSPAGVIFPVSASISRDQRSYDDVLESFSKPISEFIDWRWVPGAEGPEVSVNNNTSDLYRYFDGTLFAEYLYDRVADTVQRDLKEELGFIAIFDQALGAVRDIVDMPDRRASLFVRLTMQNGGRLWKAKRSTFAELSEDEIARLEEAVQEAMGLEQGGATAT